MFSQDTVMKLLSGLSTRCLCQLDQCVLQTQLGNNCVENKRKQHSFFSQTFAYRHLSIMYTHVRTYSRKNAFVADSYNLL